MSKYIITKKNEDEVILETKYGFRDRLFGAKDSIQIFKKTDCILDTWMNIETGYEPNVYENSAICRWYQANKFLEENK